ncbi:MAG: OFA family MFS transporter [Bacteroidales bacterium]|nr:OFA family MFS transporter [Bacteroidales bacterium]
MDHLDKRRWVVLAASCLINLCIGSIYAWSVFAAPLGAKLTELLGHPVTAADLAIVFTVANAVGPITMISGGFINDRLGPRGVLLVGGGMFGVGMMLSGLATSVGGLIVTYGLVLGLGLGMAYGATISNSVKFFPDKKGLVGGIATATYGLSSVVIPPVANALIQRVGVSSSFLILGGVFLAVILVSSLFVVKCPQGYAPQGYVPAKRAAGGSVDKNWKQMLSDPVFYVMIVMLTCGAFSGLMITSQASPMAQSITGMSAAMAATAVSVLALFNAAGRIVAGTLSDRFGRIAVLRGAFVLEIIGLGLLFLTGEGNTLLFMVAVSCIGLCFGALMGVYPGFTADRFGLRNNSVNYGIMFIGFAVAGYFGPTVCRSILSSTGTYAPAFLVAMGLGLAGILLSFVFSWMTGKRS